MNNTDLLDRLAAHRFLGAAPEVEIAWVAEHGVLRHLDTGASLYTKNELVDGLQLVLNGHLAIYVTQATGRKKVMEWRTGDVTGLMPYSRLTNPPGDVYAEEPTEFVTVPRAKMTLLIRECPVLTGMLVHTMLDRARHFTSSFLHNEKLVSLGKLAAGLAHELNNPVSAIARSAQALSTTRAKADAAARTLGGSGLTSSQMEIVENVRIACLTGCPPLMLSPLQQEEREESIFHWLKKNCADTSAAEALSETDFTFDMLDQLAAALKGSALNAALNWIASDAATHRLTNEIHIAATRIHDLVASIKGFTQMDRATVPELVDVGQGLANTLVVLRAKAKGKSAELRTSIEESLPKIQGFASELNQIWVNLIDNALDAVREGGSVDVTACRHANSVVVRIVDDGPGVPPEIRDRIFDPFFTTKPEGTGTGLGLDIVRRLIQQHNGIIELDSNPGRTEFRVTLPIPGAV